MFDEKARGNNTSKSSCRVVGPSAHVHRNTMFGEGMQCCVLIKGTLCLGNFKTSQNEDTGTSSTGAASTYMDAGSNLYSPGDLHLP